MKILQLLVLGAVLSGTVAACSSGEKADHSSHMKTEAIHVSDARILPPFPGRDTAAAYFTLNNGGADNRLVSVSSPLSERVEIHNHINDNGVMKMRRVEGVDLTKGQSLEFKPGSYHVMLFNVSLADDVLSAPLTLTFANGETANITAPIEGRMDSGEHSNHDNH